jgi:TorA maturation chaperone TorD
MKKNELDRSETIYCQSDERAVYYLLLSRLFTDQTTCADIEGYLEFLSPFDKKGSDAAVSFSQKLQEWQKKEQSDHLLKTEYARVFILAGGVRPYESIYRGESKMLMQEPWVKVKQYYQSCGLKLENPAMHPEDHASAEFAFMLFLLEKGEDEKAAEFFRQHIDQWMPEMFDEILNYPYADFFKEVAAFAQSFLAEERALYGDAIKETANPSNQ